MVLVAVQLSVAGLYLPPELQEAGVTTAPDDHFSAGPDCGVESSCIGRVGGGGGVHYRSLGLYFPPVFK